MTILVSPVNSYILKGNSDIIISFRGCIIKPVGGGINVVAKTIVFIQQIIGAGIKVEFCFLLMSTTPSNPASE